MVKTRRSWIIALAMLLIFFMWVALSWLKFLYYPIISTEPGLKYAVRDGASLRTVIDDLYAKKIIKHPLYFMLLVRLKGVSHELKAGVYLFPKGTTSSSLLHQIVTGSGMMYYTFTLVPGWNFKDVRKALLENPRLRHDTKNTSDTEIMTRMGDSTHLPEGNFFPDTYYFSDGTSDIIVLKRAYKSMQDKLEKAWQHRAANLPFKTSYDALIAASIVEKEAYLAKELPRIAGVMVNRLHKNMRLQFDPTVIYGLGSRYDGKIHRKDLLEDTPYNTYVHTGLPPTPISMPSLGAIQAVMNPEVHGFYYFVAAGDGSHQFSAQLGDHQKAVSAARKIVVGYFNGKLVEKYLMKVFQFPPLPQTRQVE